MKVPPGMVSCSVEHHHGAWLVSFDDGTSLLLQSDYDLASFAVSCGAVAARCDWDGSPSKLNEDAWGSLDPTTITACPSEYRDLATVEEDEP